MVALFVVSIPSITGASFSIMKLKSLSFSSVARFEFSVVTAMSDLFPALSVTETYAVPLK